MNLRARRHRSRSLSGYIQLQGSSEPGLTGYGDGDFVRLRDEFGNTWQGTAEPFDQDLVRYRFQDSAGNRISGISDRSGITLRDDRGHTWRGYIY